MKLGILIQGGYVQGFTLDSCRHYRTMYPDAAIVVSTWHDQADALEADAAEFDRLAVARVLSEKPAEPGFQNVNLQIVSTRAGLEALGTFGVSHAVKSRSDVRVEADVRALLEEIRSTYPCRAGLRQAERIVVAQSYTRIGMPYHASDMILMGAWSDLRTYFDVPLRPDGDLSSRRWRTLSLHDRLFSERGITTHAEQYLCLSYLRRIGWTPRCTIADWHDVLASLLCVVDDSALGFRWRKNPSEVGADARYDSDFLVLRPHYPQLPGAVVQSSLICRRVSHADWQRILDGKRPRLDAGRREVLLAVANGIAFLGDIPRWLKGVWRRRRGRS